MRMGWRNKRGGHGKRWKHDERVDEKAQTTETTMTKTLMTETMMTIKTVRMTTTMNDDNDCVNKMGRFINQLA